MTDRTGAPRPTGELGSSGPISEAEVLAAVARAERQEARVTLREISNHLGWRYNGGATIRLRPRLHALAASGLLDATNPPRRKIRTKQWSTTVTGRRRLASADKVDLPESPQHRRWRQDRDVAAWALDGIFEEGRTLVDEVYDLFWMSRVHTSLTSREILDLAQRFDRTMKAFATATQMCDEWPEPGDETDDKHAPRGMGGVLLLLPEQVKKGGS